MNQVNLELFRPETNLLALNDADVRGLAETPTGTITIANLRGKSYLFAFTISTNQTNANLRTLAIAAGWNGVSPVQATINSGIWISGSVAGNSTAALTIDGSFPNGVSLINNGIIAGRGGNGGNGGAGGAGGRALLVSVPVTINNIGTIAGGGGGGGTGGGAGGSGNCSMGEDSCNSSAGGGGGGGGRSNLGFTALGGGAGGWSGNGSTGCSGTNGTGGGTGTSTGPGGGGLGATIGSCTCPACSGTAGSGGAGGAWGTAGATGNGIFAPGAGGAAGIAITGNANVTWTAFGTRLGPIT